MFTSNHNTTLPDVAQIVEAHGLTMEEFKTYQRMMPEKRKLIYEATLKIYETLPTNEYQLAKLLGINREKMHRMKVGNDIDQLPAHYSPDEVATLRKMLVAGNDYEKIADAIGRSFISVKQMAVNNKATMKRVNPELYRQKWEKGWATKTAQL